MNFAVRRELRRETLPREAMIDRDLQARHEYIVLAKSRADAWKALFKKTDCFPNCGCGEIDGGNTIG